MSEIRIVDMDEKRFDALAGLSRSPVASYVGTEVAWLSTEDEAVIGVIVFDRTDDDFAAIVLGRDEIGRYRAFDLEVSLASQDDARGWLERMIRWHAGSGARVFPQGDTEGAVDLFTPVAPPEKLHPNFVHLIRERSFFPAKTIIGEMMPHFRDVDGNFVEQFQTTGFDARLWELYLFAYLNEEELFLDREYSAPDYCVTKYGKSVAIEAATVGPISRDQSMFFKGLRRPMTPLEVREQNANQMPLRFGSALFSKLQKQYWNLPHVTGKPLVFAIADFHDDQSMLWTATALHEYLYGVRHEFHHGQSGELVIDPVQILTHKVGEKEVPSGFFFQPDTENVSAALFSASGTISKFNRLGRQAGFKTEKHMMIRAGVCHDHDPDAVIPKAFRYLVDENSEETWGEGLSMFHNPNATYPVPEELFPSIAHHHFVDGQIESVIPPFHPYNSITLNLRVRESG